MSESLIAIVPAAGIGARASLPGEAAVPKQYRPLAGQPMLRHAVRALLAAPGRGVLRRPQPGALTTT
ncbi:2-C-methyl-D-erythritol 4-phosphate cytidylyltransferase, partial [Bordetella pertussis]